MFFKKSAIFFLCLFAGVLSAQTATTLTVSAGPNKKICLGNQDTLDGSVNGGTKPYKTTIWNPGKTLSDSTILNPIASPTITTIYTLTVIDNADVKATSTVEVVVYSYTISAGRDTTIRAGQTITLHGYAPGDSLVIWSPNVNMFNPNTLSPDVDPQDTTHYTLLAVFPNGCTLYSQLTVNVIPDGQLYFFNSFSPNGDNVNDYFVIGNIEQYPNNTFEVYNRYGQKVFSKTDYNNDWNGSYLGNELPCGTYFYILDTHDAKGGKYHGQVNIIK